MPYTHWVWDANGWVKEKERGLDAIARGDSEALIDAISDEIAETICVVGTPDEARRRVAQYVDLTDLPRFMTIGQGGCPPDYSKENLARIIDNSLDVPVSTLASEIAAMISLGLGRRFSRPGADQSRGRVLIVISCAGGSTVGASGPFNSNSRRLLWSSLAHINGAHRHEPGGDQHPDEREPGADQQRQPQRVREGRLRSDG